MGKILISLGVFLVLVGLMLTFFPSMFSWFGRLPGDIRVEGKSGGIYIPLVSMLIISIVLTVIFNLFRR